MLALFLNVADYIKLALNVLLRIFHHDVVVSGFTVEDLIENSFETILP